MRRPQYGTYQEQRIRTSTGPGGERFTGRDYEREEYGAGYGSQQPRMRPRRRWMRPGQVGGEGFDGLSSERAFGTGNAGSEQTSDTLPDDDYWHWREDELRAHDRAYERWRAEQARRYDERYERWKRERR